ncbi:hypothetical protein AB0E69_00620 [Kribbella sp. NPDC026611]|uniref:hypothetical protein n=1 Tax=Kribbella sp. NPDC026611 TaxID=3154911 RepID=UPI0033EE3042
MATDVSGGIECRHPAWDPDQLSNQPWVKELDLHPLYVDHDYASLGLLFGVENSAGFQPVAEGRGLPDDVSSELRDELQPWLDKGEMFGATWISWAELAAIDPKMRAENYVGRLSWRQAFGALLTRQMVQAEWPAEAIEVVGAPPEGFDPLVPFPEWTVGDTQCAYEPLTAEAVLFGSVFGEVSHWRHVFAVMKALAGRYGADGVRLVVAFD